MKLRSKIYTAESTICIYIYGISSKTSKPPSIKPTNHISSLTPHSPILQVPLPLPLPTFLFHLPLIHQRSLPPNLDPTNKNLTHKLQPGHKHTQQTRNDKMANTRPDIQPTALIPNHPEEIHRQHIADAHDNHEHARGRDAEAAVQDAEVGADDGEGDEEFEEQEGALGEGVEDGDEAVDAVEGEGGDGGDVAGGEEGGLDEVEEEEGGADVGEGEGAVRWGFVFVVVVSRRLRCFSGGGDLGGDGGEGGGERFEGRYGGDWRRVFDVGRGEGVDVVFETDPGDEGNAEGEVEEAFVGYGEDDEDGGEGKEHDDEAVEVVIVWLEAVEEGNGKGCDFLSISTCCLSWILQWMTYSRLAIRLLGCPKVDHVWLVMRCY